MTREKIQRKQEHLETFQSFEGQEIVLSLNDFFEWADDGSIGYNLSLQSPYAPLFYDVFKKLLREENIEEIFVRIMDFNESDDADWFTTDTVYVVGTITKEELQNLMEHQEQEISPDEIQAGWMYSTPANLPYAIPENKVLSMWWD